MSSRRCRWTISCLLIRSEPKINLPETPKRIIGHVEGAAPGPSVICLAGIHGNEPAGVLALQQLVPKLQRLKQNLRGEFVGLVGNPAALSLGTRFIDEDLNRIWSNWPDSPAGTKVRQSAERQEQRTLNGILQAALTKNDRPVYFLDMHTTSSCTAPFAIIGDTLPNREFARRFPVPLILGLEEKKSGTVADYVHALGAVTMGLEAGRHDDPDSIERHEAAAWLALAASGCLSRQVPEVHEARQLLARASAGIPRILEVRCRHRVRAGDGFQMQCGYNNFAWARKGQLLAHDQSGPVTAPQSGHILLPLYQQPGDDGFFIARRVRSVWLSVSAVLRRLGADRMAYWMPGVTRHPQSPEAVLVNPAIARWHAVEVFHLLGFRQHNSAPSGQLVFSRRLRDRF